MTDNLITIVMFGVIPLFALGGLFLFFTDADWARALKAYPRDKAKISLFALILIGYFSPVLINLKYYFYYDHDKTFEVNWILNLFNVPAYAILGALLFHRKAKLYPALVALLLSFGWTFINYASWWEALYGPSRMSSTHAVIFLFVPPYGVAFLLAGYAVGAGLEKLATFLRPAR